jgi:hypothetical protein
MNKWDSVYLKVVTQLNEFDKELNNRDNIKSICELLNITSEGLVENLIYDCYMEIEYNKVNYVQTVSDCVNKIFKIKDLTRH